MWKTRNGNPYLFDEHLGLIWIVAFEYHEDSLCGIHALGPAYSGKNSYQMIKKELDKKNLSINIRTKVFRLFEHIPIIPTNQLFQYAVMLHYCVTGRRITTNDIQFTEKASQTPSSSEINLIPEEHRGVWMAEQGIHEYVTGWKSQLSGCPCTLLQSKRRTTF